MVDLVKFPNAFAVRFRELERWNVAFFREVQWKWPDNIMNTLGSCLLRVRVPVDCCSEDAPIIEKITFGGELSILPEVKRKGYKGNLFRAESGQLIYSKIRVKQGSVCVVPRSHEWVAVSSEYPVYSLKRSRIEATYLELVLRSSAFRHYLEGLSHGGSTKTRIAPNEFEKLRIPVPPLPVQQAIVEYWGNNRRASSRSILEADNELRSIPRKLIKDLGLKELKSPISDRMFVTTWHDVERWGVDIRRQVALKPNINEAKYPAVRLRDVIMDLQNGWSPKCHNRQAKDVEWGVLKLGAVSFGHYDESQNKALPDNLKPRPQYEVKEGDLIISRANITRLVGASALVKSTRPHLMLCDKLFRVIWKVPSPIMPEYLDEVLKLPHLRWQIENNLTGASPTMKNISKPALLDLNFPLPPLAIQGKLVAEIEATRSQVQHLKHKSEMIAEEAEHNIEEMILGVRPVVGR